VTRHHQSHHHASPCHFSHLALPRPLLYGRLTLTLFGIAGM
jgi:hypothetical protein